MEISHRFPATSLGQIGVRKSSTTLMSLNFNNYKASYSTNTNLRYDVASSQLKSSENRIFILGIGYVGKFFAQELINKYWIVSGTCTTNAKKVKLEEMGFSVHKFYANEPEVEVLDDLSRHTHLLVSIPPVEGIGDPLLQHGELLKSRLVDGNLRWLGYLSSTSVYGNCSGAWVDENYPASNISGSAKARLAAEEGWLHFGSQLGLETKIFRLGGIYGPGRSAIDTILKRKQLSDVQKLRSFSRYTSRVHISDICQALYASIQKPSTGSIFNIVDDDPAPREEVFMYAQNLVEKKWPGQTRQVVTCERAESSLYKANARGDKRVLNARIKKELGVQLLYPSYRSGLQSILEHLDLSMYTPYS
ncbi:uncharacterized protein LOC141723811 [Apium graveolens]|uniref:uncharacterized protein LOC141723811 n=1 Tax=Apium graveolens TaxID=4045 RepID=UPI003D79A87E